MHTSIWELSASWSIHNFTRAGRYHKWSLAGLIRMGFLFLKRCEQTQGPWFCHVITQLKFLFHSGVFYQNRASIQGCSHQDEIPERCLSIICYKTKVQLMAKTNLPLRTELDGVWYLESHPQVAEFFKSANVFDYCERLTSFNQPLAEAFAQIYNGRTVKFGRE